MPLLQVENLHTHFPVRGPKGPTTVKAVDGVSFALEEGDVLGLVGESGCGKSTLARAVLRLVPVTEGTVLLRGKNLAELSGAELRAARPDVQMVFQDPYASLNPRMTVFSALAEPMIAHNLVEKANITGEVSRLMTRVGLSPKSMRKYPHEFSGGQRQRVAIARTLAMRPRLIIADEPVSALDVSVQAQILNLIAELCREENLTLVFISHDLSVVRHVADRIAVMYLGRIVESGPAEEVFNAPAHPYTKALISAVPIPDPKAERNRERILLLGDPPSPVDPPSGCRFHPRCPIAKPDCAKNDPALVDIGEARSVACPYHK